MPHHRAESLIQAAHGLGLASLAIGLAELTAPKQIQKTLGIENGADYQGILKVLGVRELMHGISILTERGRTPQLQASLWARVAGDVLDTVLLGLTATKTKRPARFALISGLVLGIGLADTICSMQLQRDPSAPGARSSRPGTAC